MIRTKLSRKASNQFQMAWPKMNDMETKVKHSLFVLSSMKVSGEILIKAPLPSFDINSISIPYQDGTSRMGQ